MQTQMSFEKNALLNETPFDSFATEDDVQEPKSKEPQVYSVSEINKLIRDTLEGQFNLIWLKGEISNFKAHTSGHHYFSLKDAKAQINAVMFKGFNSRLKFKPADGMEVLVRGKITVYEPRGTYQIFCELMEPVGLGALQMAYEQLKTKLRAEGLFDPAKKRPIPPLPSHIAIVTSPTGAAIRDMLNVLGRRFKGLKITLIPCKVQGDQAPAEIVQAIKMANQLTDVDVMIVGRGGGSIEDLWAFNDERVARAIAASRIPTISAVGHEVDVTIADYVADLRAPTPSAAAELVVKNAGDIVERVRVQMRRLLMQVNKLIQINRTKYTSLEKRLIDPQRRLQDLSLRCDELTQRLEAAAQRYISDRRMEVELLTERMGTPEHQIEVARRGVEQNQHRLQMAVQNRLELLRQELGHHMALLDSLSPLRVVDRGYAIARVNGKVLKNISQVKVGEVIQVRINKGEIQAKVEKLNEKGEADGL